MGFGEYIMTDEIFWKNKKVLITGHTGFKGSWLSLWLYSLGAYVTGYALKPPTNPSLFELLHLDNKINSIIGDIRDIETLKKVFLTEKPEIVIHMAAQPLVRESYKNPIETYETNVMGTVNLFEVARSSESVKSILNVTTDKCYENKEWIWAYRENEPLGGYDPYSNSKAISELITSSYRNSFFNPKDYHIHGIAIATARAGNVIGGGDWAKDRLIPDIISSFLEKKDIFIRNPKAIRPWQHVLEPLSGYLLLSEKLYKEGPKYGEAWNFGPNEQDAKPVEWIVKSMIEMWKEDIKYSLDETNHPHEATYLKLDISKAKARLGWEPRWNITTALDKVIEWTHAYKNRKDLSEVSLKQIKDYSSKADLS